MMQRNEFDLFQEENKEVIEKIKHHIKAKDDFFDERSFFNSMHPFCQVKTNGQKKLIYLCAALVKQGMEYPTVYRLARSHLYIQAEIVGVDNAPPSQETIEWRKKEQEKANQLEEKTFQGLWLLVPFIAYSGCTYDETQTCLTSSQNRERNTICTKIMERYNLYNEILYNEIGLFYDCFDADFLYIKQRSNEIVSILSRQTQAYPELYQKMNSFNDKLIILTERGDISLLPNLFDEFLGTILLLNMKELRSVSQNISRSAVPTLGFFCNNKDDCLIDHPRENQTQQPKIV